MNSLRAAAWPLLGRDQEVRAVRDALADGAGALLWGPAGVGKTSLARAVLRELDRVPVEPAADRVVHLHTPLTSIATPWSVFAPLVGTAASAADPVQALLALAVAALEQDGPALLVADDAHDLDEASATILAELVHTGGARLLATCRPAPGLPAPLLPLWRQERLQRVDVAPLDRERTEELVAIVLGGPVTRGSGRAIWQATAGNPLYVRELLASLTASGALRMVESSWVWQDRQEVGARVRDLIATELTGLPAAERDLVDLLALAGPLEVAVLPPEVGDAAVRGTLRRGLVVLETTDGAPVARLAHPVHGEVVRSTLGRDRRRELFERMPPPGTAGPTPAELFRWVDWALTCGVAPPVGTVLRATQEAALLGDAPLVRRLADVALAALPEADLRRVELLLLRAESERFGGRRELAAADLDRAGELLNAAGAQATPQHAPRGAPQEAWRHAAGPPRAAARRDALLLRHAEVRADLAQYHDDDLDDALHSLTSLPLRTAQARARRDVGVLVRQGYAGRYREFLAAAEPLCASSTITGDRARLLGPLVLGLALSGRLREAVRTADRFLRTWSVDAGEHPWLLSELTGARFMACLWLGDLEGALAPPLYQPDPHARSNDVVNQVGSARYHAALGDWHAAADHYRGALTGFAIRDPSGLEAIAWAGLAQTRAALGDRAGVAEARRRYRTLVSRTARALAPDSEVLLLTAAVAIEGPQAHRLAAELGERATADGLWLAAARARHLQLLLRPTGDVSALTAAAAQVDAPWASALAEHGRAVHSGDDVLAGRLAAQLAGFGIWVPVLTPLPGLTARQRQIASLVAAGLTNREIAERLVLSVRTVDSHVSHIFTRLGIGSRADLTFLTARSARE